MSEKRNSEEERNKNTEPDICKKPSALGHIAKFAVALVLSIYIFGAFVIALPYFNWQYAKEHGFVRWMFLGQIVPTMQTMIWPYYAYNRKSRHKWTEHEKDNLEHFRRAEDALIQIHRIEKAGPSDRPSVLTQSEVQALIAMFKLALEEAGQVDLDVLAKTHPGIVRQFQDKYLPFLEVTVRHFDGRTSRSEYALAETKYNEWIDWYNANRKQIHMPKRQTSQ